MVDIIISVSRLNQKGMPRAAFRFLGAYYSALVGRPRDSGGWSGVASMCCGVVRVCGAQRARVCADAVVYAKSIRTAARSASWGSSCVEPRTPGFATLAASRSTRCCSPIRQRSRNCGACTVEYDRASDNNCFRQACTQAAKTQCHSTSRGNDAWTHACTHTCAGDTRTWATVALPDWCSGRCRRITYRAANG